MTNAFSYINAQNFVKNNKKKGKFRVKSFATFVPPTIY
jgi:hypothetical protein